MKSLMVLAGLVVSFAFGFILALAIHRPAKVHAAGFVYVDEVQVRSHGVAGQFGTSTVQGSDVVGFSCAQGAGGEAHCFVASR